MNKKLLLILSICLLCTTHQLKAQLQAFAGVDTVWCTYSPSTGIKPVLGGNPSATGGMPPYAYQWSAIGSSTTYLSGNVIANPQLATQTPINLDSLDYELKVTDGLGTIARDTVRVFFSHFMCTLGECIKFKNEEDTVQLGVTCFARLLPSTFSWTPTTYLNDPTSGGPKSWSPVNQHYSVEIKDRKGCIATSSCDVVINSAGINNKTKDGYLINISPNPATSETVISLSDNYTNGELSIYSIDGKQLSKTILTAKKTSLKAILSQTSAGIYFYKYQKAGLPQTSGKFLIQ